jgi:hypothetical protein
MLSKNIIHKFTSLSLTVALLCVSSMVALAGTKDITGEISVTGQVTVNGQSVVSSSTVVSGSTIATSDNSTAVISLGKTGRLELLPESNITLKFTDGSITGILSAGKVRVSNAAGVATTITTKDSVAIADAGQADTFVVEVECSHTHVDTMSGLVTLRNGGTDKQVAAGTDATAGNLSQAGCKPCLRPNPNPGVFPVAGAGYLVPLLIAAGGGVAAAILLGSNGTDDVVIGGPTNVVSGIR